MASSLQIRERASFPDTEWRQPAWRPLLPWLVIGFSGLLLLAVALLWRIWTADALRSIGMYFPIVSVVLILRIWRGLDWETRGSWWGLLPLYYAVIMAREGGNALQAVAFTPRIAVTLLPLGLTVFAYASGVVLLLGGVRVWRAALFPIALLLFVNPVPKAFELVDLPLQFVSAHAAQSFALAIGVHPDVNQLRLMFAPGFGMFIAPGCDGIRGAVTLGYLALILGYLYRFSMRARTLVGDQCSRSRLCLQSDPAVFSGFILSPRPELSRAAAPWRGRGLSDRRTAVPFGSYAIRARRSFQATGAARK